MVSDKQKRGRARVIAAAVAVTAVVIAGSAYVSIRGHGAEESMRQLEHQEQTEQARELGDWVEPDWELKDFRDF